MATGRVCFPFPLGSFRRAPCLWRRGEARGGCGRAAGSGGRLWRADSAERKSLRWTEVAAASDDEQQIRRVSRRRGPPRHHRSPPRRCWGAARPRFPPGAPRRRLGAARARRDESRGRAQPRSSSPSPARLLLPGPEGMRPRGRRSGGTNLCSWRGVPHRAPPAGGGGEGRGPPFDPASRSSFPAFRREWGGRRDLRGAGRWRGVCWPEGLLLLG